MSINASASIYVVHDTAESSVRSLTFQLSKLLTIQTPLISVRNSFFKLRLTELNYQDVIVTVGVESFRHVCSYDSKGVVIAMFIGKEEYLEAQKTCSIPSSGVFSGAPLGKRLDLLASIWPDKKPLAILYSDYVFVDEKKMEVEAAKFGFKLQFLKTEANRLSVLKSVNFILEESELILAFVDSELYKNGVAQDILKLLFHKKQVMVGPSAAFVRAGSLFAIHSDSKSKLKSLVERLDNWLLKGELIPAGYPDSLRVSFNPYVIRSHGIVLPSASYLKDKYDLCSEAQCS